MEDWESPLQLVAWIENGKIKLIDETISKLKSIDKPLVIPCIVGSFRMGKSFLMNRLFGRKTGFPLGNTIQSETKGIWVWYKIHPKDPNKGLLLMDTEGLDNPELGDGDDMFILSLSLLLCSTFIFNVIGKVDNTVIERMDFVTEISKHIRIKSDVHFDTHPDFDFYHIFPLLVLVCRDKLQELIIDGEVVTPDEYMERMMLSSSKKPTTKIGKIRLETKLKLRKYFPKRKCFFFPRPVENDKDMLRLEELPESDLRDEFLSESDVFVSYIIDNSVVKNIDVKGDDVNINGESFVNLLQIYTRALNDGAIPCIGTACDMVIARENDKLLDECVTEYKTLMAGLRLPLESHDLDVAHKENHKIVVDHFASKVYLDESNEHRNQLQQKVEFEYIECMKRNRIVSRRVCNEILEYDIHTIQSKLDKGEYNGQKGYDQFVLDSAEMRRKYDIVANKGEMANEVFEKYQDRLRKVQINLTQTLDGSEQKTEEEKLLLKEMEMKLEVEREKSKRIEERLETLTAAQKAHGEIITKKYEEKLKEFENKYQELFRIRAEEKNHLLDQNLHEEGDELQSQLDFAQRKLLTELQELKQKLLEYDQQLKKEREEMDKLRKELEEARKTSKVGGFLKKIWHKLKKGLPDALTSAGQQLMHMPQTVFNIVGIVAFSAGQLLSAIFGNDDDDDDGDREQQERANLI